MQLSCVLRHMAAGRLAKMKGLLATGTIVQRSEQTSCKQLWRKNIGKGNRVYFQKNVTE